MAFIVENKTLILAALFAFSEVLGAIPAIKANNVFGFLYNTLKGLVGK